MLPLEAHKQIVVDWRWTEGDRKENLRAFVANECVIGDFQMSQDQLPTVIAWPTYC